MEEMPELAEDPRFDSFGSRATNKEILLPLLREAYQKETTAVWVERMKEVDVLCSPVLSPLDWLEHVLDLLDTSATSQFWISFRWSCIFFLLSKVHDSDQHTCRIVKRIAKTFVARFFLEGAVNDGDRGDDRYAGR